MVTFLLAAAVLILLAALLLAIQKLNQMQEDECIEVDADHAKCVAHIASLVSDEFAARVLEQAAADWDAPEGMTHMKVLARLKYQAGGPSMPNIWLRDRAARLRKIEEASHE